MKIWKILFVLFLLLFILDLIGLALQNSISAGDAVGVFISGFSLIPVYGFAYQVAIGSKSIAIAFFSVNLLAILFVSFLAIAWLLKNPSLNVFAETIVSLMIFSLLIYATYMYAFKSNHLWGEDV